MIDSAWLSMIRRVSSAIPSIERFTSAIDSRPTSGTIMGGCGAIPEKTNELQSAIARHREVWAAEFTAGPLGRKRRSPRSSWFREREYSIAKELEFKV